MKDKISIIVPVYNTQEYLNACVESLVNQSHHNIEILLIDDGSTDNSSLLCEQWALRDSRVKVEHKENGGQGTARNLGLDLARGDYIAFVDSDDYVEHNMYESLLRDIKEQHADIASCGSSNSPEVCGNGKLQIFNNSEIMYAHAHNYLGLGQSPCDKLFKKELFESVRFPQWRAYEDCATIYKALSKSRKLVYRDWTFYHYIPRKNSTMTQGFSAVKFKQIDAYWNMYQDYRKQYPQFAHIVKGNLVGSCQYCMGESYRLTRQNELHSQIVSAQNKLKKIDSPGLTVKHRLTKILMTYVPCVFSMIYKIVK